MFCFYFPVIQIVNEQFVNGKYVVGFSPKAAAKVVLFSKLPSLFKNKAKVFLFPHFRSFKW